jgi:hypothetical protein
MDDPNFRNVPIFRAMVQQYKIDRYRGVQSSVSETQFAFASSIRPVKLPERRTGNEIEPEAKGERRTGIPTQSSICVPKPINSSE